MPCTPRRLPESMSPRCTGIIPTLVLSLPHADTEYFIVISLSCFESLTIVCSHAPCLGTACLMKLVSSVGRNLETKCNLHSSSRSDWLIWKLARN